MTYKWTTGFEEYPQGNDFGSSMGKALRDLKKAFQERLEIEHEFETGTGSTMMHLVGKGSIVGMSDGTPASLGVDGGLQWDYTNKTLYHDDGASMTAVTTKNHGELDGLGDDDHTQYLLQSGGTITADIEVSSLTGMPTSEGPNDDQAMSQKRHLDDATAGGARHDDDVISDMPTDAVINGVDKLNWTQATATISVDSDGTDVQLNRYSTMIRITTLPAPDTLAFYCSTVDSDDYVGRFRAHPRYDNTGDFDIAYDYLT